MVREQACQRVYEEGENALWGAAHLSEVKALPLSPSHSVVKSRSQSWLKPKLPMGRRWCQWALLAEKPTLQGRRRTSIW